VAHISSGDAQANAAAAIAWQWSGEDPQAVGKWAASFPESATRSRAFESLINRWAQNDTYAAGSWLRTLPSGESRDAAVGAFARHIANADPQTAVEWAASIGNESQRYSQIEPLVITWMRNSGDQASAWISASSLPQEMKARLLAGKR